MHCFKLIARSRMVVQGQLVVPGVCFCNLYTVAIPCDFLVQLTDFLYAIKCETVCILPDIFLFTDAFTWGNMQSTGLNSSYFMLLSSKARLAC